MHAPYCDQQTSNHYIIFIPQPVPLGLGYRIDVTMLNLAE